MADKTRIEIIDNSPLIVCGEIKLVDAEGNPFSVKKPSPCVVVVYLKISLFVTERKHRGQFNNCSRAKRPIQAMENGGRKFPCVRYYCFAGKNKD